MEFPRKLSSIAALLGRTAFAIFRKTRHLLSTLPEVMHVPVDLHDQLSEFSYGYGVTREVELQLASVGLRPTPFLPSLLHEAVLGFDVKFDRPGAALLLQFKLGEALQRFRRDDTSKPPPPLEKPFWRFSIDTAEQDGQFDLLLKAEQAQAEVYYVAPRFRRWDRYVSEFQSERVLYESLLLRPSEVEAKLASQGLPDGWHRIIYDQSSVFVCSEPTQLDEQNAADVARAVRAKIDERLERIDVAVKEVQAGLGHIREIRRPTISEDETPDSRTSFPLAAEFSPSREQIAAGRRQRLEALRAKAASEADAMFAAVGLEMWAIGAQLIAVTLGE